MLRFSDSDTFRGEFVNGAFEGTGTYRFSKSGKVYVGEFKSNRFHGKGELTFEDSSIFSGSFTDGRPMQGVLKTSLSSFSLPRELFHSRYSLQDFVTGITTSSKVLTKKLLVELGLLG